ncbi:hypothetical protein [Campylobacter sp. 7477a]|uniref:hypothetical protein n=1 Tax=Campylobacter sp. 7477a TaxID=2735741 RepID=UPI0030156439|nr:hypothetical protein [Campylobacter sp. 7477a]
MRNLAVFAAFALLLSGCADKHMPEPTIVYREKLTPVKCNAQMPVKPKNDGTFETDKTIMIYFRECESRLKQCIGVKE